MRAFAVFASAESIDDLEVEPRGRFAKEQTSQSERAEQTMSGGFLADARKAGSSSKAVAFADDFDSDEIAKKKEKKRLRKKGVIKSAAMTGQGVASHNVDLGDEFDWEESRRVQRVFRELMDDYAPEDAEPDMFLDNIYTYTDNMLRGTHPLLSNSLSLNDDRFGHGVSGVVPCLHSTDWLDGDAFGKLVFCVKRTISSVDGQTTLFRLVVLACQSSLGYRSGKPYLLDPSYDSL